MKYLFILLFVLPLYGQWNNGESFKRDAMTEAINIIDYAHHEIHGGSSYFIDTYDTDLDTGDTLAICFKTPDTKKWLHMIASVETSGSIEYSIYEGATITADDGTDITIWNRNRNSSNTSGILTIESSPEAGEATLITAGTGITAGGDTIKQVIMGSGSNPATARGGTSRGEEEFILEQNTIYAFIVIGQADNIRITISLSWYEHISKED